MHRERLKMSFLCVLCALCGKVTLFIVPGTNNGYGKGRIQTLRVIMHNFGGIFNKGLSEPQEPRSRFKR